MSDKPKITHIASVLIVHRRVDPGQIYLDIKDDGLPAKVFRRALCPIGGNWIGVGAEEDKSPLETALREFGEEQSLERMTRDSVELALLGQADVEHFEPTPINDIEVTDEDRRDLERVKEMVSLAAVPFGDRINTITKAALDSADPKNEKPGFTHLCSYFQAGLPERTWVRLVRLQKKFGNLSNESVTVITSLDEILKTGTRFAYAHDLAYKAFFLGNGFAEAENLPFIPTLSSVPAGHPVQDNYDWYRQHYEIERLPEGLKAA